MTLKRIATASCSKLKNMVTWIFKAHLLIHSTLAVQIKLVTATCNLCFSTEISTVVFDAHVTCIFQMMTSAFAIIFITALFSLKGTGAATI
jgi:hypothetical protein